MIQEFYCKKTEALFREGVCDKMWPAFGRVARKKLLMVDGAHALRDLKAPPGNKLEALNGDRVGQHSIRVNKQYRVCFIWKSDGAYRVEINKHYE